VSFDFKTHLQVYCFADICYAETSRGKSNQVEGLAYSHKEKTVGISLMVCCNNFSQIIWTNKGFISSARYWVGHIAPIRFTIG